MKPEWYTSALTLLILALAGCAPAAPGAPSASPAPSAAAALTLTLFGAGTLAAPFTQLADAWKKQNPNVTVQSQFGGSVKMVKQVTELHQVADVVAVADYSVIPQYLFGAGGATKYTDWYVGFATNAITFVYTDKSKFAGEITPQNWYQVLARPGVQIGRSNPDTDPSGYQTVQMLDLAEQFYKSPGLALAILNNAPKTNMRDTETELIAALESGQIDYLAIYRSDALQHKFKHLDLPPDIDLSDAQHASFYAQGSAQTANGKLTGKPIVYAVTIPNNAAQAAAALKLVQFLIGPDGQAIMRANGFGVLSPAYANDTGKTPAGLNALLKPWPAS